MIEEPAPLPAEAVAALRQLDELILMFAEHHDEAVQDGVVGVLRAVDILHRGALQSLTALLDGHGLLHEALADPRVALLFGLYESQGDDSDDERSRAEAAVARIGPYVEQHGGRLEVVTADGGVVNIRLLVGEASGAASPADLRTLVEEALRAELPEFVRMDVAAPPAQPEPQPTSGGAWIPLSSVTRRGGSASSNGTCGARGDGCSGCR